MTAITILGDEVATVAGEWADGRPLIELDNLPTAIGWTLNPHWPCCSEKPKPC